MRISATMAMVMAAIFTAICLGFAITGFVSLREITDPQQASDATGFAWFWTFLAAIGIVFGIVSWWISRAKE
jgi:hypothetical protein